MIKLKDLTPDVYYKESRDFQFIGRLYDLVLNSVKTEADSIYALPLTANSDDQFLTLAAMTMGFKLSHHYTAKQLRAICQVFPLILKNKGNIKSVIIACNALFNAEGLEQEFDYDFTPNTGNTELNLYVPETFSDTVILNDILAYTLPAGMSCNIIKELRLKTDAQTDVGIYDEFKLYDRSSTDNEKYNNNVLAKIMKATKSDNKITYNIPEDYVADYIGFRANGSIYKPTIKTVEETEEETNS